MPHKCLFLVVLFESLFISTAFPISRGTFSLDAVNFWPLPSSTTPPFPAPDDELGFLMYPVHAGPISDAVVTVSGGYVAPADDGLLPTFFIYLDLALNSMQVVRIDFATPVFRLGMELLAQRGDAVLRAFDAGGSLLDELILDRSVYGYAYYNNWTQGFIGLQVNGNISYATITTSPRGYFRIGRLIYEVDKPGGGQGENPCECAEDNQKCKDHTDEKIREGYYSKTIEKCVDPLKIATLLNERGDYGCDLVSTLFGIDNCNTIQCNKFVEPVDRAFVEAIDCTE